MKQLRNVFVAVADDCPVVAAEVPPRAAGSPSLARLQYELLAREPYRLTQDDLDWAVHAARTRVPAGERAAARAALLARGRPCMRASPLTKRYGWGAHYDGEGRIAIHAVESDRYRELRAGPDGLQVARAMRSRRAEDRGDGAEVTGRPRSA